MTSLARASRRLLAALILALVPAIAVLALPAGDASGANAVHVVKKGQTIEQVAQKYGVTVKSIVSANKLKDPTSLKPGTKLVIPPAKGAAKAPKTPTYEGKPKHPGRVTMVRLGTKETQTVQVLNKKGKLAPGVLARFARMMRFGPLNMEHAIDPRLVSLVAKVSDHFGGRSLEIISGFRPKKPNQYTPHSNHNVGKALDFRIPGVPNEVLRDYCKTFKQVGVGYYPNSLFVHFDVRKVSTTWIDLSKSGEPPKYVGSIADADHANDDTSVDDTADTAASASTAATATPSSLPAPTSIPSALPKIAPVSSK